MVLIYICDWEGWGGIVFIVHHRPSSIKHRSFDQFEMLRRSHHHSTYWIIFIDCTGSAIEKYHIVQVDNSTEETLVCNRWDGGFFMQRLPPYMNNLLASIKSKSLYCSFCLEILLDHIGSLASKYCYTHLFGMFESEESFTLFCIECVSCCYIEKTLESLEHDERRLLSREEYWFILKGCKELSKRKRFKRCSEEMYLGTFPFPIELIRAFHEFIGIVSKTLGFLPFKFQHK